MGEPTETALRVLAEKLGVPSSLNAGDLDAAETWQKAAVAWRAAATRMATLEFDRGRKSMSVVCADEKKSTLYVKGAPDSVLRRCTKVRHPGTGATQPLDDAARSAMTEKINELARRPLRCLALATRDALPSAVTGFKPGRALGEHQPRRRRG